MNVGTPKVAPGSGRSPDGGTLLQLRSDRRLGHEWEDWDGEPLPNGGSFTTSARVFFGVAAVSGVGAGLVGIAAVWLLGPRLNGFGELLPGRIGEALPGGLYIAAGVVIAGWLAWLGAVAIVLRTGRNWLPRRLGEGGLLPWAMPKVERAGRWLGISRDRLGNAMLRVFNGLSAARAGAGVLPAELLILLPRCLGKEAMQRAMSVSSRYGVPLFVAARGRYARQMIALRRPKAVVAVACERDLVSGVHDVAGKLPVLGTVLTLPDGPCRNTELEIGELESRVRKMLGLQAGSGSQALQ